MGPRGAGSYAAGRVSVISVPRPGALTRELLGWQPTHPGLLDDLDKGHYFDPPFAR